MNAILRTPTHRFCKTTTCTLRRGNLFGKRTYSNGEEHAKQHKGKNRLPWKWAPIPIGVGLGFIGVFHLYHRIKAERMALQTIEKPEDLLLANWKINLLRALPLRATSRLWGGITHIDIPVFLRAPLYRTWASLFGSDLSEASATHLSDYPNLATFFVRELKTGLRPISGALVVSPADGRILHFGEVTSTGFIEQIKDVTYSLTAFLGDHGSTKSHTDTNSLSPPPHTPTGKAPLYLQNPKHKLYYCVVYLGPGDYHRFHSPTSWTAEMRRHFPGDLLSVHPNIIRIIQGLFVYNERVCLFGKWPYGFFSMTAVGATNVGSIRINFDDDIDTNQQIKRGTFHIYEKKYTDDTRKHGIPLVKGIEVGAFHLGSTIVLVFEAPSRFHFNVQRGQKIKLGEPLGDLLRKENSWYSPSSWWPYRPTKERSIRESPVKVANITAQHL